MLLVLLLVLKSGYGRALRGKLDHAPVGAGATSAAVQLMAILLLLLPLLLLRRPLEASQLQHAQPRTLLRAFWSASEQCRSLHELLLCVATAQCERLPLLLMSMGHAALHLPCQAHHSQTVAESQKMLLPRQDLLAVSRLQIIDMGRLLLLEGR